MRKVRRRSRAARVAMFDEITALYDAGSTVREIAQELALGRQRVHRWVGRVDLRERNAKAPKLCTPGYFGAFLARSWAEGMPKIRQSLLKLGVVVEATHRAKRRLFGLAGLAPLDRRGAATRSAGIGAGRDQSPLVIEPPVSPPSALPPLTRIDRSWFDYGEREADMAYAEPLTRETRCPCDRSLHGRTRESAAAMPPEKHVAGFGTRAATPISAAC